MNQPQSQAELEAVRTCARRERPYGDDAWARKIAAKLGSEQSLRPRGRPRTMEGTSDGVEVE
ncbi:MAG TPA: hypothetical protein VN541_24855 [Tepidisphaeraceae bacterium]|nr:hypothetical protein [Tepidisphaeraceae bacterium]